jgi:hypothetical protein
MKARSTRLAVETLEDRCVPSTVAYGDFNNDGRMDMAAITAPTTVTVSLANPDGSYTVSAILSAPKNQPMLSVTVGDFDADGDLDVRSSGSDNGGWYIHTWLGEGDGTFGSRHTDQHKWPKRYV